MNDANGLRVSPQAGVTTAAESPQKPNAEPDPATIEAVMTHAAIADTDIGPAQAVAELATSNTGGLCQHLLDSGLLTAEAFARVAQLYQRSRLALPYLLSTTGGVDEQLILASLRSLGDFPGVDENALDLGFFDTARVSIRFLKHAAVCPLHESDEALVVAMADPTDGYSRKALEMAYGKPVLAQLASVSQVERLLERLFETSDDSMSEALEAVDDDSDALFDNSSVDQLIGLASETPVVRLVNIIVSRAVELGASDIHIEPFDRSLKVRYRIDGVLMEVDAPPASSSAAVVSRLKIMAKLDIAERRLPQDGRIQIRSQGKRIDLRVSTIPTLHGESLVLRILDKEQLPLDFKQLGFEGAASDKIIAALDNPFGIILVTGPTGSGKTTTLYAALERLNQPERKILTVEDPVEYQLEGINQMQVKQSIDLTFARALRSIVRQDPDIIMIGEMRDLETAGIAVQSALTGHLVLSTLHTNNAAASITRLLDMGVEDYLLTSTVIGVVAQRLLRTLCGSCKQPYQPDADLRQKLFAGAAAATTIETIYRVGGCDQCAQTGYRGRSVIFEYLEMTESIRGLVLAHADASTIEAACFATGMESLQQNGYAKVRSGQTSLEEVLRVTQDN